MENKKTMQVRVNLPTYKKLQEYAVRNYISVSEIFRVLISNSNIKIDSTRNKTTVISQARKSKELVNSRMVMLWLNEKLILKMREMKLANDASYSEIARCLVDSADFKKLKFKTIGEINSIARQKSKKTK